MSRIDRILVSPKLMKNCHKWEISAAAGKLTDHRLVSVCISAPGAPYIGKGRWAMPLFLLYDKEFMGYAIEEACKLEDSMEDTRTEESNTQTRFKAFKDAVLKFAKKRAKTAVGATEKKKQGLVDERELLLNGPEPAPPPRPGHAPALSPEPDPQHEPAPPPRPEGAPAQPLEPDPPRIAETDTRVPEGADTPQWSHAARDPRFGKSQDEIAELVVAIENKIDELVDRQRERRRLETRVRGITELNHITKYAVNISKEVKPRDTLSCLRRTDITPERSSRRSSEMAEIARDYHNDIQADGLDISEHMRNDARREALDALPPLGMEADMKQLSEKLNEDDVLKALMESASGKAAGINGYATEFWRRLESISKENNASEGDVPAKKTCDIVKVLTWVFNDIEEFGMVDGTEFSLGWMCPL
ncbi:hypothetical protein B0H19DRAFT_1267083 [Mycena capillaripes]|nr:hypothetical protein B0H19DRAFT_1267083 [Mycena capillaripes]